MNDLITAELYNIKSVNIQKYREYALGLQTNSLTEGQKQAMQGLLGCDFADNIVNLILTTNADAIQFNGWDVTSKPLQTYADDLYENEAIQITSDVHYSALRDGNTAVVVNYDKEINKVTLVHEQWYDGRTGVFVGYDSNRKKVYAVREWVDEENTKRRIIWLNNRVERYFMNNLGLWTPFTSLGLHHTEEWVTVDGEPLSIPVIHFANRSRGSGVYGLSELHGGALAFQDQINAVQYDASICGRFTGFQQYYATGVPIKFDEAGKPIAPRNAPGVWHVTDNEKALYGTLPAGDVDKLKSLYLMKVQSICRVTRTPLHFITGGDYPAGEAIFALEKPFTRKVKAQIKNFQKGWQDTLRIASSVENTFGQKKGKVTRCKALFENADKRDPLTEALAQKGIWEGAALAISAGIPLTVYLKEIGWTDDKINMLKEEQDKDPLYQMKMEVMQNSAVNPLTTSTSNNVLQQQKGLGNGQSTNRREEARS